MRVTRVVALVALSALLFNSLPDSGTAQTEWPNCPNFVDQDDAQATYDADRGDPFDLESSEPVNDVPCEDERDFGTQPLVSCDALREYPDAQQALQGLYDHTRAEGDPYGLDQGADPAIACDGGGGRGDDREDLDGPPPDSDQEELDGPPPERSPGDQEALDGASPVTGTGTNVVVSATPLDDFDALEARLDARFAALEAQFAAFEVRAENGFGRIEASGNDALAGARGSSVVLTARQTAGMTQRAENTNAGTQAVRAQHARGGETIGAQAADRLTVRNDTKRERDNERKAKKRDRHDGKQRNRR